MEAKHYYECHVTIEPVFGERLERANEIAKLHDFRIAGLIMVREATEPEQKSTRDTFMSSRGKVFSDIEFNMIQLIIQLRMENFKIFRYKIEDTMIDSRIKDELALLV